MSQKGLFQFVLELATANNFFYWHLLEITPPLNIISFSLWFVFCFDPINSKLSRLHRERTPSCWHISNIINRLPKDEQWHPLKQPIFKSHLLQQACHKCFYFQTLPVFFLNNPNFARKLILHFPEKHGLLKKMMCCMYCPGSLTYTPAGLVVWIISRVFSFSLHCTPLWLIDL